MVHFNVPGMDVQPQILEPMISVIVSVYNIQNYVEKSVQSICNQTYKNLEIILVDDGATDSSGKICDELAARDSRVKVIHKPNGGLSSARNEGVKIATGEYIAFVDGDDWIASPDAINIILDYAYFTGANYIQFEYGYPKTFQYHGHPAMVWQYVFERGTLSNIRFTDIQPHEDLYFMQAYQA